MASCEERDLKKAAPPLKILLVLQSLVNTLGEHHATANVLQIRHGLGLNSATETVKLLLLPLVLLLQQPTQD